VVDAHDRWGSVEPDLAVLDPSWYTHDKGAFTEGTSLYTVGTLKRSLPFWTSLCSPKSKVLSWIRFGFPLTWKSAPPPTC
jgi:hypothetical protein